MTAAERAKVLALVESGDADNAFEALAWVRWMEAHDEMALQAIRRAELGTVARVRDRVRYWLDVVCGRPERAT